MSFKYYVYAYIRKIDGTPYYIGKGCNKRAIYGKHFVTIPRDKSKIVILESNLSEVGALALERRYIEWYGRKDIGTGILHNKTEGGEVGPTNIGRTHSEATKEKIRLTKLGKTRSEETKSRISATRRERSIIPHNKGNPMSEEQKQHLSTVATGRKQSAETIAKRVAKTRGQKRSEEQKQKLRKPMSEENKAKRRHPHKITVH